MASDFHCLQQFGYLQPCLLGNGSSGSVYSCIKNGKPCAVKCMQLPEQLGAYLAEQKLPTLRHPNIIELYAIENIHSTGFIVTELLATDIMGIMEKYQRVDYEQARNYFFQICIGLGFAHSKNIAHLDIKPENIFLDNSNFIKIGDWGSSITFNHSQLHQGASIGTFFYCAPEMLVGKPYQPDKCDIWSLGILLHTMVTGKWPYFGKTREEIFEKVQNGEVKIDNSFGIEFYDIISSMLQIDPNSRPSTEDIIKHPWLASIMKRHKKSSKKQNKRFEFFEPPSKTRRVEGMDDLNLDDVTDRIPAENMCNLRAILNDTSPRRKKVPSISNKAKIVYRGVKKIIS